MKVLRSKILCVTVLAFTAVTACKTLTVSENAKVAAGESASTAPNSNVRETDGGSDPKAALLGSMKNLQDVKSWIAEMESSNDAAPNADVKMQIKYLAPDSFQIENNAAGNKMQIVAVGGKTYLQMGGKWQEAPASVDMGQMINNWRDMFSDQKLAAFKNIQAAGKETVDGRELAVYTYEIDQEKAMPDEIKKQMTDEAKTKIAEMRSENKAKMWIDEAKNLPAKMEMTMKMSNPQTMTQKLSVNYIYDREVKIEAPKLK